MANLEPIADKAVHDAVDAFVEGRRAPPLVGDTAFETRNSRYHVRGGVVASAPDPSLLGAELVGWLIEQPEWSRVEPVWQPGARAVLVDRHRGRNIIVTSTTRLLAPGSPTPGHAVYAPPAPAVHPPPRPIHATPSNVVEGAGVAWPVPVPAPPPRRDPLPPFPPQVNAPEAPAEEPAWWVTSAELEPASDALRDDALHRDGGDEEAPESRGQTPIPLVRPVDPRDPGWRRG